MIPIREEVKDGNYSYTSPHALLDLAAFACKRLIIIILKSFFF